MVNRTKEFLTKLMDFIESKIAENGGEYFIRFDDAAQMNEFAAYVGLPQCDHGRAYLAEVLRNPADPDASVVGFTKSAAAAV